MLVFVPSPDSGCGYPQPIVGWIHENWTSVKLWVCSEVIIQQFALHTYINIMYLMYGQGNEVFLIVVTVGIHSEFCHARDRISEPLDVGCNIRRDSSHCQLDTWVYGAPTTVSVASASGPEIGHWYPRSAVGVLPSWPTINFRLAASCSWIQDTTFGFAG